MGRKEVTVLEEGTFEGPEIRKGASCVENQERSVPGTGDASTKPRGQKALSTPKKLRPPERAGRPWGVAELRSEQRRPSRACSRLSPTSSPCHEDYRQPGGSRGGTGTLQQAASGSTCKGQRSCALQTRG